MVTDKCTEDDRITRWVLAVLLSVFGTYLAAPIVFGVPALIILTKLSVDPVAEFIAHSNLSVVLVGLFGFTSGIIFVFSGCSVAPIPARMAAPFFLFFGTVVAIFELSCIMSIPYSFDSGPTFEERRILLLYTIATMIGAFLGGSMVVALAFRHQLLLRWK